MEWDLLLLWEYYTLIIIILMCKHIKHKQYIYEALKLTIHEKWQKMQHIWIYFYCGNIIH